MSSVAVFMSAAARAGARSPSVSMSAERRSLARHAVGVDAPGGQHGAPEKAVSRRRVGRSAYRSVAASPPRPARRSGRRRRPARARSRGGPRVPDALRAAECGSSTRGRRRTGRRRRCRAAGRETRTCSGTTSRLIQIAGGNDACTGDAELGRRRSRPCRRQRRTAIAGAGSPRREPPDPGRGPEAADERRRSSWPSTSIAWSPSSRPDGGERRPARTTTHGADPPATGGGPAAARELEEQQAARRPGRQHDGRRRHAVVSVPIETSSMSAADETARAAAERPEPAPRERRRLTVSDRPSEHGGEERQPERVQHQDVVRDRRAADQTPDATSRDDLPICAPGRAIACTSGHNVAPVPW